MKILCRKHNNTLIPYNELNEELLREAKIDVCIATIKKARNSKLNSKYWVLLNTVVENSDYYTGIAKGLATRALHKRIKVAVKLYTPIAEIEGNTIVELGSTSFPAMDELEFQEFYNSAIDALLIDKDLGIDNKVILEFVKND